MHESKTAAYRSILNQQKHTMAMDGSRWETSIYDG